MKTLLEVRKDISLFDRQKAVLQIKNKDFQCCQPTTLT